jgi:hypothetical protein
LATLLLHSQLLEPLGEVEGADLLFEVHIDFGQQTMLQPNGRMLRV